MTGAGKDVQSLLTESKDSIATILESAERELESLEARRRELQTTITGARMMLGSDDASGSERLTLHAAIEKVIRESDEEWLTVREIANEINERALYSKRDGSAVETNQIHARVKNYAGIFRRNDEDRSLVGLLDD
ncbi:MAG: hypothetical protein ACSLFF_04705 [Solirubrobacterales bacterium]